MSTSKKISFVSILLGCLLISFHFSHGQNAKAPLAGSEFSTQYYVYAGEDATICSDDNYTVKGISTFNESAYWHTNGDGFFINPFSLKTTYIPGAADIAKGYVVLSLGVLFNKSLIYDEMTLYFGSCVGGAER
jgi:hypothetical protein